MKKHKVRIYVYDRETGRYRFRDHLCTAALEDAQLPENGGAYPRDAGSIRIFTRSGEGLRPGCYASFDLERESPDKGEDYFVTAVRDNRRGGLPHWRLIVNGRTRGQN